MPPEIRILEVLKRHDVPLVIVGGHAVIVHGYARATEDLDVVWHRTPESEPALTGALTELSAQYIGSDIDPTTGIERLYPVTASYVSVHHLMMLWTAGGFLDLFDYIPGHPQHEVTELFETSIEHAGMRVASLGWLRKMKTAAGREKDLLDLRNLPEN